MKNILIENDGKGQKAYNSLAMDPRSLGIFANELALRIIRELSRKPRCAMDLARKLEVDEQKIYYHVRKMEKAGVVKLVGTETRYGMTAKIYRVMGPVVSAKLYDDGHVFEGNAQVRDPQIIKFLEPFIKDGKLNAKIIIGSPYPHGNHEATARDGAHITDLALFLGGFLNSPGYRNYKIDTEVRADDLKGNLILIGGPKINTVMDRINKGLPIYFDEKNDFTIVSKLSGEKYDYDNNAVIIRAKNPFNEKKEILILAGKRSSGLRSAVLAFIEHAEEIMIGNLKDRSVIAKVVEGIDKDSDGIVDSVRILE
jgi:DNA-binding transcriptional ArsR family regulator